MHHQSLESERYYLQDLEQKIAHAVKLRNRKAVRDLTILLVGLALIPLASLLGEQLPTWTPVMSDWLNGWINVLYSPDSPIGRALEL